MQRNGADRLGDRTGCVSGRTALQLGTLNRESGIKDLADRIWQDAERDFAKVGPIDPSHLARGLFLCFARYPRGILYVGMGRDSLATWFRDLRVAGDANNSAKFFIARFYNELKSSVADLIFLAAHTITTGAKLAPTGVGGGLDISRLRKRHDAPAFGTGNRAT